MSSRPRAVVSRLRWRGHIRPGVDVARVLVVKHARDQFAIALRADRGENHSVSCFTGPPTAPLTSQIFVIKFGTPSPAA